jgi:hypothetical protein
MSIYILPIDIGEHDFFAINRTFRHDFAARCADEALSPELDSVSTGRFFVTYAIRCGDIAAVGDRVAALNRFPGGMLRDAEFFFLCRVPADGRRIKNNLCAAQCR